MKNVLYAFFTFSSLCTATAFSSVVGNELPSPCEVKCEELSKSSRGLPWQDSPIEGGFKIYYKNKNQALIQVLENAFSKILRPNETLPGQIHLNATLIPGSPRTAGWTHIIFEDLAAYKEYGFREHLVDEYPANFKSCTIQRYYLNQDELKSESIFYSDDSENFQYNTQDVTFSFNGTDTTLTLPVSVSIKKLPMTAKAEAEERRLKLNQIGVCKPYTKY